MAMKVDDAPEGSEGEERLLSMFAVFEARVSRVQICATQARVACSHRQQTRCIKRGVFADWVLQVEHSVPSPCEPREFAR